MEFLLYPGVSAMYFCELLLASLHMCLCITKWLNDNWNLCIWIYHSMMKYNRLLTYLGRMTQICVGKLIIIGSGNGLKHVVWKGPSHYRNQCWNIFIWTLRNKLQWNFDRTWYIFNQDNAFENVVWQTASILSRPLCVKRFYDMNIRNIFE